MEVKLMGVTVPHVDNIIVHDPEAVCAAAAWVSHNKTNKTVMELLGRALKKPEDAMDLNNRVIFGFGHSMPAEMVTFVFAIENVSRVLCEVIHGFNMISSIERSQRYIEMEDEIDWVIPYEIECALKDEDGYYKEKLIEIYNKQLDAYKKAIKDGESLEDARRFLPLAMPTRLVLKVDAHQCEYMISALRSLNSEAKRLADLIYCETNKYTSIIKYTSPTDYSPPCISLTGFPKKPPLKMSKNPIYIPNDYHDDMMSVKISEFDASLLIRNKDYRHPEHELEHHPVHIYIKNMTAYTYAQLKRHRTFFMKASPYISDVDHFAKEYADEDDVFWLGALAQTVVFDEYPTNIRDLTFSYLHTNNAIRNVKIATTLRGLSHFIRLRSKEDAQKNIRSLAKSIFQYAREQLRE